MYGMLLLLDSTLSSWQNSDCPVSTKIIRGFEAASEGKSRYQYPDMIPLSIAVHGAAGRMGQRVAALASADAELRVAAALEAPMHPKLGVDVGLLAGVGELGVAIASSLDENVDVMIDFSVPEATALMVETCCDRSIPLVVATTGLSDEQRERLQRAAAMIPIAWAPNMSLAVNIALKLSEIAARALKDHPSGVDVEIIERHHRFKEDAPSGTALWFGQTIAGVMGQRGAVYGRHGRLGQRLQDHIGYHAVRVGDDPGQHTVIFGLLGETLELRVAATSRDCYAHGALAAAKFVAGMPPGLYGMNDVLGL
jgi:4-hydroxy-tetrahydrodipicolinate reductase